ncbi:MAG: hypothetical protein ACKVY0_06685 [Prosthecobacter sp.]|uniref:hypothetical protein n=1 Tax=Prosthecobacter sp. TaxID=1965333 RepID=UPI0038FDB146
MIIDEIIEFSEAQPFVPFEVRMADGDAVMVRHPKWMMFTPDFRTLIVVGSHRGKKCLSVPLITQLTEHPEEAPVDMAVALRA